ncbi:MAG: DNA replication/repair protein RecF [Spirochaetaceae bacterium]|nr:MAG: DNA replication/repair protein RecF [Spirochaetaceae bacterium]
MSFQSVRLYNYRNLANATVSTDASEVFLVGENGQGKSNFLEAVYVLCYGSSFRTRTDGLLPRQGTTECSLSGQIQTDDTGSDPEVAGLPAAPLTAAEPTEPDPAAAPKHGPLTEHTVRWRDGKKDITVDGETIADRRDLVRTVPCIVFCHDDIQFVRGAPEMQRYFFDQTLSLDDPLFIDTLRAYRKILRLRNSALKEYQTDLLPVYDQQLAATGLEIQRRRREAVDTFSRTFAGLFRGISGSSHDLAVDYRPSWKKDPPLEKVLAVLESRHEMDLSLGTTTTGPHRDRFRFVMDGADYTQTASTGQLRLTSLVLRVAQARFFSDRAGRKPLLLLDDVLLELDPTRRERFLHALPAFRQAFFTLLPDEQFTGLRKADTLVYRVHNGRIEPEA